MMDSDVIKDLRRRAGEAVYRGGTCELRVTKDEFVALFVAGYVTGSSKGSSIMEMYREQGELIEKFTCDECGARFTCWFVFDAYNTDGDCLAEK